VKNGIDSSNMKTKMFLAVTLILLLLRTRMESAIIKDKALFHDYDICRISDGCRDIRRKSDKCRNIRRKSDKCRSRGISVMCSGTSDMFVDFFVAINNISTVVEVRR
jgi:hypothetical protein